MCDLLFVFFIFVVCFFFFGEFNDLDKFIFYLGWFILNYVEIVFRYDIEM